jgi:hypothetical protein
MAFTDSNSIVKGVFTLGLLAFVGGLIWTFVLLGENSGSKDNSEDVKKALGTVAMVNGVLIAILAGISFLYIGAEPTFERPYILVMLHASLFFSLMGASSSAIQQLSVAANSSQDAKPSSCPS